MSKSSAISSFFSKEGNSSISSLSKAENEKYELPPTEDPVISAFYAQLTDNERIAHAIALTKLGTSYDVTRTHGFVKWSKKTGKN